MKNLPIGIQTFSKFVKGDYLYVDKTESIFRLISGGGGGTLSRPVRVHPWLN
ncbi:MAG: AAA family ATPase [bacterium]|nr:AAA family ATPase [bacterium]